MQSRQELAKESIREFDPLEFDRFTRFQEVTRLMAESVSDVSTVHGNLVNAVDETEKALLAQARLNRDLQQDLMRVRMVPFGSLQERPLPRRAPDREGSRQRANLDIKGTRSSSTARCSSASPDRSSTCCASLPASGRDEFRRFRACRGLRLSGVLDAVRDGVAQQVLERSGDALEHRAVELGPGCL